MFVLCADQFIKLSKIKNNSNSHPFQKIISKPSKGNGVFGLISKHIVVYVSNVTGSINSDSLNDILQYYLL